MAAGIVGVVDAGAWLFLFVTYHWSDGDPATRGFDEAAAWIATILFAVAGAPALVLAVRGRAPRPALLLALGFPAVFALLLLLAAVYALA
jgi:hypothetical protein